MKKHDNMYKRIFENKEAVRQLLVYFSGEEFVTRLDYNSLIKIDKSFITAEFIDREADILYKINFQNSEIYIYLLIEFQSSPEKFMPRFEYCKIAENEFSNEFISKVKNFVSAVFFIENSDPDKIKLEIDTLIGLLKNENPELIEIFRNWFLHAIKVDKDEITDKLDTEMEVVLMGFAEKFDRSLKNAYTKGVAEGIEKTIKKMLQDGVEIRFISRYTGMSVDEIKKIISNQ